MRGTPHEHALLAYRWLHAADDRLWADFPRYWMAFNALYNAVRQEHDPEARAATKVIRLFFEPADAPACLQRIGPGRIAELVALPPGDDRLNPTDPHYRSKATAAARIVSGSNDPVERLAALITIVYQVRCNLLHGSKDPAVMRDQALVTACTPILQIVVPQLEEIMERHHGVPQRRVGPLAQGGLPNMPCDPSNALPRLRLGRPLAGQRRRWAALRCP
jgi:hypothetical protein